MKITFSQLAHSTALISPPQTWSDLSVALASLVHPADFWQGGEGGKLGIDQVRDLQRFAIQSPVGEHKLACLMAAGTFRQETANALLKLLEEPPPYLWIILLAEVDHFLPTVRSRLRILRLSSESATITATNDPSDRQRWQELFTHYNLGEPSQREQASQLLYLHALIHPGIRAESVLEPYIHQLQEL